MNYLQPIPPGGDVIIEAAQADPAGWIVALVVAGISLVGTIGVAWYSHLKANQAWLKDQRRDLYTKYREYHQELNTVIQMAHNRNNDIQSLIERLNALQKERITLFASLQVLASPEVAHAYGFQETAFAEAQSAVMTDAFPNALDKLTSAATMTGRSMALDLGVKPTYAESKQRRITQKLDKEFELMTSVITLRREQQVKDARTAVTKAKESESSTQREKPTNA